MRNGSFMLMITLAAAVGCSTDDEHIPAVDGSVRADAAVDAAPPEFVTTTLSSNYWSAREIDVAATIRLSCAGRESVTVHATLSVFSESGQDARSSTLFIGCPFDEPITVAARFDCYKQTFVWADVSVFDSRGGRWVPSAAVLTTECGVAVPAKSH